MATKNATPTLAELDAQIAELQTQAEQLRSQERAGVVERIRVAIEHYALTAADLGLGGAKPKPRKASVGASAQGPSAAAKPAKSIKFADDQGHRWSGVGKRPNWFKAAIAAGKTPEDLMQKGPA